MDSFWGHSYSPHFTMPKGEGSLNSKRMTSLIETEVPGKRWRVRGSGVRGRPTTAPVVAEIQRALQSAGIAVRTYSHGSAANADSYHLEAQFSDGRVTATTGTYMYGSRGCWIEGPRAMVQLSVLLCRSLAGRLLNELRAADPGIDQFLASTLERGRDRPAA